MVYRSKALFEDVGMRLRAVRQELSLTMEELSKAIGISRSYLSDFERGFRLPTSKYLQYLHNHHKVNLNYIFGGEGRMFRAEKVDVPDFGRFQDEVDNMLRFMGDEPAVLHAVLGFAIEYEEKNKDWLPKPRSKENPKSTENS